MVPSKFWKHESFWIFPPSFILLGQKLLHLQNVNIAKCRNTFSWCVASQKYLLVLQICNFFYDTCRWPSEATAFCSILVGKIRTNLYFFKTFSKKYQTFLLLQLFINNLEHWTEWFCLFSKLLRIFFGNFKKSDVEGVEGEYKTRINDEISQNQNHPELHLLMAFKSSPLLLITSKWIRF